MQRWNDDGSEDIDENQNKDEQVEIIVGYYNCGEDYHTERIEKNGHFQCWVCYDKNINNSDSDSGHLNDM